MYKDLKLEKGMYHITGKSLSLIHISEPTRH